MELPEKMLIVDTETTGLEWFRGDRPFVVGLAFADGKQELIEITSGDLARLRSLLEDPAYTKIGHNVGFDIHMLQSAGFDIVGPFLDTEILARYAFPMEESFALKALARSVLKVETANETEVQKWVSEETKIRRKEAKKLSLLPERTTYADVPRDLLLRYLGDDLRYTAQLAREALKRLTPTQSRLIDLEMKVLEAKVKMETRGVPINVAYFKEHYDTAQSQLSTLKEECAALVGHDFNWLSTKQLGEILYKQFAIPVLAHTKKGAPSTDEEALSHMDHPIARKLEAMRGLHKLSNTYYQGLSNAAVDGVIYPSFRQHGAVTGRFSCASPNLQNIPAHDKSVRLGFVCRTGYVQVYIDFSQIEWRILAHYTGDPLLINPILNGQDSHIETAKVLFGRSVDKKHPLRQVCKTLNYELGYGGGFRRTAITLREQLRGVLVGEYANDKSLQRLADIDDDGARKLQKLYYKAYPSIPQLLYRLKGEATTRGRVTDLFGKDYWIPPKTPHMGLSYKIQGTAAVVMKRGLVRLQRHLDDAFLQAYLTSVVHDEFQIEVATPAWTNRHADLVAGFLKAVEDKSHFVVPLTADVAWSSKSWGDKAAYDPLTMEVTSALHSPTA